MPNENAIDLFVKLEFGELYLSNLKFSIRRQRYLLLIIAVFLAVVGSLLIHIGLQDPPDDRWTAFADNIKPLFYVMSLVVLSIPVTVLLYTKKLLRDPRAKNGSKYHVTTDGVRVEGSAGTADLNWTAFLQAREISTAFWLFVTTATFHLIPKRCFATNDDLVQFREIIRANIPKTKLRE